VQNYRNLLVWQKAHTLAVSVKKKTEGLRDRTGAATQARRSALSIPTVGARSLMQLAADSAQLLEGT
jgi:hypothetical protein